MKKVKRDEDNVYTAFNKWLKLADPKKVAKYIDPYYLEGYHGEPKSVQKTVVTEDSVELVASKLSRIKTLEERLRHIEEMKQSLNEKFRKLQKIQQQESDTKTRIENEVSEAEREWNYSVDRLEPGSYRPLDSLGDLF